jgi:hypothetical protein
MDILSRVDPAIQNYISRLEGLIKQLFNRLDKNIDGSVSQGELRTFLFDYYEDSKKQRNGWAAAIINRYDRNGDNRLSLAEVRAMVVGTLGPDNMDDMIRSLQLIVDAPCMHVNTPHTRSTSHLQRDRSSKPTYHSTGSRQTHCPVCMASDTRRRLSFAPDERDVIYPAGSILEQPSYRDGVLSDSD